METVARKAFPLLWLVLGVVLAHGVGSGCAEGVTFQETRPTSAGPTSGSGNGSGAGTGVGGGGGAPSPCGIDCTTIQAPPCQLAQCNEVTTQCEIVDDADGTACEDGVFCTASDTCQAGLCVAGLPNDCGMTAAQCQEVTCNETSQTCGFASSMNGSSCQPTNLCTSGATCTNGLCIGGTPTDCFFFPVPDQCHVAECDPLDGFCKSVPGNFGGPCTDSTDLCTLNKTCNNTGSCQGGTPKDCTFLTQGCNLGVCNTSNGQCITMAVMNGQPCNDLNACTAGEICTNAMCGGGAPVTTCSLMGDGCCPTNCNVNNDLDCAIQPSCKAIKMSIPSSMSGVYTLDPDGPGPLPQLTTYCDMTTDGGGWTLMVNRNVLSDQNGQPDINVVNGTFDNTRATNWNHDIDQFWAGFTEVVFADKQNANCAACEITGYDSAIKAAKPNLPSYSKACTSTSTTVTVTKLVGPNIGMTGTAYTCAATLGWGACGGNVCHYGVHHQNTSSDGQWSQNLWNEMHFPSAYSSYRMYGQWNGGEGQAYCRSCGGALAPTLNMSSTCCQQSTYNAKARWTVWIR